MKFENGKIYKIESVFVDDIYIGCTTKTLSEALREKKHFFKLNYQFKEPNKYLSSFIVLKYSDAKISLLEDFHCNTQEELQIQCDSVIDVYKCNLVKVANNNQEYGEDLENKEHPKLIVNSKKTKGLTKEKQQLYNERYKERNKERMQDATYKAKQLEYIKAYQARNKEKIALANKARYEKKKLLKG